MKVPVHAGIIMDGNGRWAQRRGLPRIEGHREGAKVTERIVIAASEMGIKYLSLYAFSTENWKRPEEEVNFLFHLMYEYVKSSFPFFLKTTSVSEQWEDYGSFPITFRKVLKK